MRKTKDITYKPKFKYSVFWVLLVVLIICLGLAYVYKPHHEEINNTDNIDNSEIDNSAIIDFSLENFPAKVTVGDQELDRFEGGRGGIGEEVEIDKIDGTEIPTIESVESSGPVTEINVTPCPEGEECGRGAVYPNLDVSSPQAFANETLGACIDVDGYYGSQCWDSMSAFFYNYAGRVLDTCGTGAAKGSIADGCWQQNAGEEFVMVWNPTEIQAGDIAVYSTGTWGHIGMAMGDYNNGYFTLLGQNQGGKACPNGGAAGNIINLSTRDFIGAFRPVIYIKPEPTPEPDADKCNTYKVTKGDTLGNIMLECIGEVKWGQEMEEYAKHWYSTIINPNQTVFYGWTHGDGYGLFAEDVIEYRK